MISFLEILKYTVPALVVLATAYYLLRQYLNAEYNMKALELKAKYSKDAIPLKLQAYERLLLFCDRISIPNLLLRLRNTDMSGEALKSAMIISVQKEFEHNIAQQLYTSQKLWDIITLTKNDVISMINSTPVTSSDSAKSLADTLLQKMQSMGKDPVALANAAIKEEAKIILNV